MNSKILFLAPFPSCENSKDGMISRIKDIDKLFDDVKRTYLILSLRRNTKKLAKIGLVDAVEVNPLLHFWYIIKLISSHDFIYVHSLFNLQISWVFLIFFNKKKSLVLDVHGVVPEESRDFYKQKVLSVYFSFIEWFAFRRLKYAVFVTSAMSDYYKHKYSNYRFKPLVYYIIPCGLKDIDSINSEKIVDSGKKQINIIYSGGIQPWQNVDIMLETIQSNQKENIFYTILTPNVDYIKEEIIKRKINPNLITVEVRNPSDLWSDYLASDYAFILRDDNLVNNVACPTKLFEYLYYGLTPIILSPNIGDFNSFGFDYIDLKKFNDGDFDKPSNRSSTNMQIAKKMIDLNSKGDIRKIILLK
jgi:glycosyltransferase involved in cell wall biosynthesis